MSVEQEIEYRPEGEFQQEVEIPAETCEGGLGAARPTTDTASQYTTADKPEVTASYISQEVTTSLSTPHTRTVPPHSSDDRKHETYRLLHRDPKHRVCLNHRMRHQIMLML